jgi:hypothetical protein
MFPQCSLLVQLTGYTFHRNHQWSHARGGRAANAVVYSVGNDSVMSAALPHAATLMWEDITEAKLHPITITVPSLT